MSLLPEISQASAEINKLVAQANIHQTIAPVNPAAFTDPADTALLASRDPVIREVSVGMTGVEAVQNTVSGTPPLSLPNSLGKPLKAWSVDVLPKQEGTGDPSPDNVRPIHGTDKLTITTAGKNLWTGAAYRIGLVNGIPFIQNFTPVNSPYTTAGAYNGIGFVAPVKGGVTYAISSDLVGDASNFHLALYASIEDMSDTNNKIENSQRLNNYTPSQDGYVLFSKYYTASGTEMCWTYAQCELGSIVTDYVAPQPITSTVLTLPQTVYTGTIGSEVGESRTIKFIPNIINKQSTNQYGISNWAFKFDPPIEVDSLSMCNLLKKQTTIISQTTDEGYFLSNATSGYLRLDESRASTVAECNQWIADNDFYLIVTLSAPDQFPLTTPTIPTPTGSATTWATAEDGTVESMEVTYIKSE